MALRALRPLTFANDDLRELDPEEQKSVLRSLSSGALSGLSAVGNTLDTGGGAVRALLAGQNPLMGALSWDQQYRPTGRDLLRKWGAIGDQDTWGNWLAGLALEIATDPLSYATFGLKGALTAGGKTLEKMGMLSRVGEVGAAKATSRLEQAGLRSLMNQGLTRAQAAAQLAKNDRSLVKELGSTAIRTGGEVAGSRWSRTHATVGDVFDDAVGRLAKLYPEEAVRKAAELGEHARDLNVSVDDLRKMPVAGQFGVSRIPFGSKTAVGSANTPILRNIANTLDTVGSALRWGEIPNVLSPAGWVNKLTRGDALPSTGFSPGRATAALFSAPVKGAYGTAAQLAGKSARDMEDMYRRVGLTQGLRAMRSSQDLINAGHFTQESLDTALRVKLEEATGQIADDVDAHLQSLPPPVRQQFDNLVNTMREPKDFVYGQHKRLGLHAPDLTGESQIKHFPRYLAEGLGGRAGKNKILSTDWESTLARRELFTDIPGGTETLKAMSADPQLVGPAKLSITDAANRIQQQYRIADKNKAEGLAGFFRNLPDEAVGKPMFGSSTRDLTRYLVHSGDRFAAGQAALDFIGMNARQAPVTGGEGLTSVANLLEELRFIDPATKSISSPATEAIARAVGLPADRAHEVLQWGVPTSVANEATKILKPFDRPAALNPTIPLVDSLTNLWKSSLTSLWPAFHFRNRLSGLFQNILGEAWSPSVELGVRGLLRQGKPIAGSAEWEPVKRVLDARFPGQAHTDEDALKVLQEMAFSEGTIGRYQGMQHVGPGLEDIGDFAHSIPGLQPWRAKEKVSEAVQAAKQPGGLNPLNVRGVGGRMETGFAPMRLGEDVGWLVEAENRLTPFFSKIKRGFSPGAAAERTRSLQADYSHRAFSDFENTIMRRLFPFYGFHKSMLTYLPSELYRAPGGRLGQTIRATERLQGETPEGQRPILPDYLSQGVAIPLGENKQGGPRILGGFNLMHEPAAALLGPASALMMHLPEAITGRDTESPGRYGRQVLQEIGGQTSPLIKPLAEWAFGRSLFQRGPEGGRELAEQDPLVGRIIANVTGQEEPVRVLPNWAEHVLANSPAARVLTSVRQATDPRKWDPYGLPLLANLGLGFRVTDVTPESQEGIVRDLASARLAESPISESYEQTYIPKAILDQLDPDVWQTEIGLDRMLKELSRRSRMRARGQVTMPLTF